MRSRPSAADAGNPHRKPDALFADCGYDHDIHRAEAGARRFLPAITRLGSALGTYRWVVEWTMAWIRGTKRLRIRCESRADVHEAFLKLVCLLVTMQQINSFAS
jgi:hypothetical protein